MDLAAGTLVDGKYRVVRPIGRGGMGAVYEVENVRIRKTVAMKLLSANAAEDVVKRFEKEAQAAGQIGSEHIVEVHDLGTMPSGEPYMVMELLEGETLRQRLHREKRLSAEASVPILVQMLEGLGAAHGAGIVHRDLKPENIFLCTQRGGLRDWVKVLDFGISKFSSVSEDGMTKTGQVIGTPQYMAPEQIKAPQTVDGRTDLYAVGVIFYQLLTGHIPFKAKTYAELLFKVVYEPLPHPTSFVPDLDREACDIVLTAMNRDPAGRFPTAAAFRDRLLQLGARLGAAPEKHAPDAMRAFLVASSAGLARVGHDGSIPSPSPSRPNGPPPGFASSSGAHDAGGAMPFGPQPAGPPLFGAHGGHPVPTPGHHTPSAAHGVSGSTSWPGSGSWPQGSVQGSQSGVPHQVGAPSFGTPSQAGHATAHGGGFGNGPAATQLFPMSSSSPSHPALAALSMSQSRASLQGSTGLYGAPGSSPGGVSGIHGVPTPSPSFGGVPVQAPTQTLATSGGRKTAFVVAAAVFAVGLGATAFVVTRQAPYSLPPIESSSPGVGAVEVPVSPPTAPPPAAESAAPVSPPTDIDPAPSASVSAKTAPSAAPTTPPPVTPRKPPPGPVPKDPKAKEKFGY